jgi:hypothetical protein
VLDRIIERNLMEDRPEQRKRIAFQFEYAQYLVPSAGLNMMARGEASRLVRLIAWAQNPYIKRVNMAFCLIAEKMSELSDRLVQNPHVAAIEIPLPDESARRVYIEHCVAESGVRLGTEESAEELSAEAIARMSNGLNLVNLHVLLSRTRADGRRPSVGQFRQLKKGMIERQCQGLVTFVEPKHTLDKVVGHTAAKERLRQDARWIGLGRLETAPMGYLICGPVGNGQDVSGRVLRRLDRHPVRHPGELSIQIRGRDRGEPGTGLERPAQPGTRGGDY